MARQIKRTPVVVTVNGGIDLNFKTVRQARSFVDELGGRYPIGIRIGDPLPADMLAPR